MRSGRARTSREAVIDPYDAASSMGLSASLRWGEDDGNRDAADLGFTDVCGAELWALRSDDTEVDCPEVASVDPTETRNDFRRFCLGQTAPNAALPIVVFGASITAKQRKSPGITFSWAVQASQPTSQRDPFWDRWSV